MALRGDRDPSLYDVSYFVDTACEAGGILSIVTGGSGVALDDTNAVVGYNTTGSGATAVGVLLQDVVNRDLLKTHLNYYKNELQVGDKAPIAREGWVVTNLVLGTPTAASVAYLGYSGYVSTTRTNTGWPTVGQFLGSKDADGYVKVFVRLPSLGL
jgi:hypothetical protein